MAELLPAVTMTITVHTQTLCQLDERTSAEKATSAASWAILELLNRRHGGLLLVPDSGYETRWFFAAEKAMDSIKFHRTKCRIDSYRIHIFQSALPAHQHFEHTTPGVIAFKMLLRTVRYDIKCNRSKVLN